MDQTHTHAHRRGGCIIILQLYHCGLVQNLILQWTTASTVSHLLDLLSKLKKLVRANVCAFN